MAGTVRLLLLLLCLSTHCSCGKPTQWGSGYSGGKGSSASSRWGHWNQRQESWGNRGYGDRELVVRVETGDFPKSKKKRSKKDKKRHKSSSSESSAGSTSSSSVQTKKKQKKSKKEKRAAKSEVLPALSSADFEELQAFRRQAEVAKIRAEVQASMSGANCGDGPGGHGPGKGPLTPKTKKLVQSQARVLGKDGGVRPLVHGDFSTWEHVEEQLADSPAPVIKQLLQQLSPDTTVPRLKSDVVRMVLAELQSKDD